MALASLQAELIFVAGPQKGERVSLTGSPLVAGRSAQAQIMLREESISRQQLLFETTADGWACQNMSPASRIRIGKRKYKAGKQLLLATGDAITVGVDTTLLFVAAGDDGDEAVWAWRGEHPESLPTPVPVATEEEDESAAPAEPAEPIAPPLPDTPFAPVPSIAVIQQSTAEEPEEQELTEQEQAIVARRAKVRKILIILSAYLALMGVFVVLLVLNRSGDDPGGGPTKTRFLTDEQIEKAIAAPLTRSPNPFSAKENLDRARSYYKSLNTLPKNMYLCVKHYRLYIAFQGGGGRIFATTNDERQYDRAREMLTEEIQNLYGDVNNARHREDWVRMDDLLKQILVYIPVEYAKDDKPVNDVIVENCRALLVTVGKKMAMKKK